MAKAATGKHRHTSKARAKAKGRGKKIALMGAAAATAVAMTVGATATPVTPAAKALTLDGTSTGPIFRILPLLGVNQIGPIDTGLNIPGFPTLSTVTINLTPTSHYSVNLADTVNAAKFGPYNLVLNALLGAGSFARPYPLSPDSTPTGPILLASGSATVDAIKAYEALRSNAQTGQAVPGYTPLEPRGKVNSLTGASCSGGFGCIQGTNVTNLALLLLRNPGTPNGGINARFAGLFNFFGKDPVSPDAQSGSSTGLAVNGTFVNIALGYDLLSDFPEVPNPFSLANSALASFLPTYLLGGTTLQGADFNNVILNNLVDLVTTGKSSTSYSTLVPNDLPLLEPLRLPSRAINALAGAIGIPLHLGTPLADALQPALKILVNIGYTDVQTPSQGGTYNRTFDLSNVFTPFMSKAVLTPQEWVQVPGDVVRALVVGFQDAFPVLRFGNPAPSLVPDGNHLAISYSQAIQLSTPSPVNAVSTFSAVETSPATNAPTDNPVTPNPPHRTVTLDTPGVGTGAKPTTLGLPSIASALTSLKSVTETGATKSNAGSDNTGSTKTNAGSDNAGTTKSNQGPDNAGAPSHHSAPSSSNKPASHDGAAA